VGLSKSFKSYTLHITTLDLVTGREIKSEHLPSSIHSGLSDVLSFPNASDPGVVWLDTDKGRSGAIMYRSLIGGKTITLADKGYKRILDIGLGQQGIFVGLKSDETGVVFFTSNGGGQPGLLQEFIGSVRLPVLPCSL
jgi:hypothetical protein